MKITARKFLLKRSITRVTRTCSLFSLRKNLRTQSRSVDHSINFRIHCELRHSFIRQNIKHRSRITADSVKHNRLKNCRSRSQLISLHNVNLMNRTIRTKVIHDLFKIRKLLKRKLTRKRRQISRHITHLAHIITRIHVISFSS